MKAFVNQTKQKETYITNDGSLLLPTNKVADSIKTFAELVQRTVEMYLGEQYQVKLQTVTKNNGVQRIGLIVLDNQTNIAPTIYLNRYFEDYKKGKRIADICNSILSVYQAHRVTQDLDMTCLYQFEKVKQRICYKVIHAEKNKELLKEIPYVPFHDLAIVFYILVFKEDEEYGSITISHKFQKELWNVTTETLYELASVNTKKYFPSKVSSMESLMKEFFAEDTAVLEELEMDTETNMPLYVATNQVKLYGANIMLDAEVLKQFAVQVKGDFYIIPSSVHEVLFVPVYAGIETEELNHMIKDVNETVLSDEEFLSNHVYYYDSSLEQV
ncbi:MAG: hypothetical protein IKJ01_08070, partial [Lachnospiraceae bacterium]|nr:hypothetical protein [Lachnospiraceae bacterium]